ncbi:restriction endonuclease subunit S [Bacillus toyonensis]|uniref:restriction endonuclease subunit S n=1 Tax=Bacillus toyonensis TaxID=155322 RepID=UPI000BF1D7F0|nr:restriction endonuclease subunit S [Bacillus toyonensis]PEJ14299.1 restriction endonuclease subunit S [Bacillus toyonensis]
MKLYTNLKESGLNWLKEIPSHWEILKIKYVFENLDYKRVPLSSEERGSMKNKIYDYYGASGVIDKVEHYIFDEPLILIGEDGANLYSRSTPLAFVAEGKYWVNNHAHILKPKEGNLYYWANLLESINYTTYITGSAQPKLTQDALANIALPVPPAEEQESIWGYLGGKLNGIDNLIEEKKVLIMLLDEKRQSMITEVVTKGLNPNVKMKDTGVEWIGEIPEHWEIKKIRYTTYVKGRIGWQGLKAEEFINEGPYLVTGTDFNQGGVDWGKCYHITEERYMEAPEIQLQENDLLITKDGTIGKLALIKDLPGRASLNSHLLVLRPLNNLYSTKYLYWYLSSNVFIKYVDLKKTGTTFYGLSQDSVERFLFALPSMEEQKQITSYLDEQTELLDLTISMVQDQIQKLKDYRQSLIYEAVTGKIDVRNFEVDAE